MKPERELFQVELLLPGEEKHSVLVAWEEHIWDAAFKAGIVLPALCHQGYRLTCAGRLEGQGEVDQSDSLAYFPLDREAGFVLLCTGKPRSDLKIRTQRAQGNARVSQRNKLPAPYS